VIGRIWAIALNTFREAARIRILYGALAFVVVVNLGALALGKFSASDPGRVARDFGLAGVSLFGCLTAIVLGVVLLYTEIARRTIHVIAAKPIDRWELVVGKYLGMALVLTALVAVFALAMVAVLAIEHRELTAAVGKALVLSWCEVLVVAAIAIFFSAFSTPYLSGLFTLGLWALGRIGPDVEAATRHSAGWVQSATKAALEIVPNLHLYSVSGRSLDGAIVSVHADFVPWSYVGWSAAQGLGWIVGLLVFAAFLFHRRDFV
jgi:ABC-type transport system involved in multi-copper enzyme maturation permease subunit